MFPYASKSALALVWTLATSSANAGETPVQVVTFEGDPGVARVEMLSDDSHPHTGGLVSSCSRDRAKDTLALTPAVENFLNEMTGTMSEADAKSFLSAYGGERLKDNVERLIANCDPTPR